MIFEFSFLQIRLIRSFNGGEMDSNFSTENKNVINHK